MRTEAPTHYDTLRVALQAAPDEVRTAYRRQAQKYHPDRNADAPGAQQQMALINDAYAVLSDPARRATYDRWVEARALRIAADEAVREAAEQTGFSVAWPWLLLCATIAFAMASWATVLYKSSVPSVAAPRPQARVEAPRPALLAQRPAEGVAQAANR